jgi:hypothetical protein
MDPIIGKLCNRLDTLMGDIDFRGDDRNLESPEQLMAIGKHNLRELQKIEDMDPERQERIQSLHFNILTSVFQEEAVRQYGKTDTNSVKRTLEDWSSLPENRQYVDRVIGMVKQCVARFDLTKEQEAIVTHILDELPNMIMNTLVEIADHRRLLPRAEAQSIAMTLADMMREAGNANGV